MKTITFKGMGWENADSSKATDLGNCRIRTELKNKTGRTIFIELIGIIPNKNSLKSHQNYKVCGTINSCFYTDSEEDSYKSYSRELAQYEYKDFEYNKENLLKILNTYFECDYSEVIVDNS